MFNLKTQLRILLLSSWQTSFLLLVPAGFATYYSGVNAVAVFIVNFFAIVALGGLLSLATREMELRSGAKLSAVTVITFGFVSRYGTVGCILTEQVIPDCRNAVNLVTSITALAKHQTLLVQTSMIGAVLSNILLMTGTSLLLGHISIGYKSTPNYYGQHSYQDFNPRAAETMVALLAVSCSSLIIPSAFDTFSTKGDFGIIQLSRATALILLAAYASYMLFLLRTHHYLFEVEPRHVEPGLAVKGIALMGAGMAAVMGGANAQVVPMSVPEEERALPGLSSGMLATTLIIVTTLLGFCTAFAVDSVDGLTQNTGVSQSFIGLILLPVLSNNMYAVKVARQGRLDLSLRITIDNGLQISLLVIPLVIVIGWMMGIEEMTLLFDKFQIAVTFLSILILNYIISQRTSNWSVMLLGETRHGGH